MSPATQDFAVPELLSHAIHHHQAGQLTEAERLYREILAADPRHSDALHLLGVLAKQSGHYDVALNLIQQAIAIDGKQAIYYSNLGTIFEAQQSLENAATAYQRALELKPDYAQAHHNLGGTLTALNRLDEAITHFERALALTPFDSDTHNNLGFVLESQGKTDQAASHYERALSIRPNYPEALNNLGNVRQVQDRLTDAIACYARALSLKPDYTEAFNNMGNALQTQGNLDAALLCFDQSLMRNPNYAHAAYSKALVQLLQGDYSVGWTNYESRWRTLKEDPLSNHSHPRWNGEKLAQGNLLIWGEQGVGDEIMFVGLMPDVLRTNNTCILQCDPRLKPLIARSFPQIDLRSVEDSEIAAQLPMGDLPRLFRPSLESFAKTTSPYLKPDPAKRDQLRRQYSIGKPIIGVVWHTNNKKTGRLRSIDLARFAPLWKKADKSWVSLQYGDPNVLEAQIKSAKAPILLDRSIDQLQNLDHFAAQIAAMDLVITIDNSTAHLAGALGVPVWLLLPFAPDWRWLLDRSDSPWYPTARLFRQPQPRNWDSVLQTVAATLNFKDFSKSCELTKSS